MEESHTEKENTTGLSANNVLIKAQGNNVVVQVSASASQLVLGKKQSFSPGHYADKLTSIAAFFFFYMPHDMLQQKHWERDLDLKGRHALSLSYQHCSHTAAKQ